MSRPTPHDSSFDAHAPNVSFYQDPEDTERARRAIFHTQTTEGNRTRSHFIARAVMAEVKRLEGKYNGGRPFPPTDKAGTPPPPPKDWEREIEDRWPELFEYLDETRHHAVVQAIATSWHEGWGPTREHVKNLTDLAHSVTDKAECLGRVREVARRDAAAAYENLVRIRRRHRASFPMAPNSAPPSGQQPSPTTYRSGLGRDTNGPDLGR